MPRQTTHRFRISPDTIADPDTLGDVLDEILLADTKLRRLHRQLVRHQRVLRAAVTDEQWLLYMAIEELFNYRWDQALSAVARQFYAAGLRAGRRST